MGQFKEYLEETKNKIYIVENQYAERDNAFLSDFIDKIFFNKEAALKYAETLIDEKFNNQRYKSYRANKIAGLVHEYEVN